MCRKSVYKLGEEERVSEDGVRGTWRKKEEEEMMKKLEYLRDERKEEEIKEGVSEKGIKREKNAAEIKVQGCECVCAK